MEQIAVKEHWMKIVMKEVREFMLEDYKKYPIWERLDYALMIDIDNMMQIISDEQNIDISVLLGYKYAGSLFVCRPDTIEKLEKLELFELDFMRQYGKCIIELIARYNDMRKNAVDFTEKMNLKYREIG